MKPFFQDKKESRISSFETLDYAPHLHSALEIGFLSQGESRLSIEGKEYPVKEGDFFVIFPNLIHSFGESRGAKGYLAILTGEDLAPFFPLLSEKLPKAPTLPYRDWGETSLKELICLAEKDWLASSKEVKKGYCRVIAGTLVPLLALQSREAGKGSALREILTYLSAHSTEDLTRKKIARALGLSESSISHVFSDGLKTSLPVYLNSLRLGEAEALLAETNLGMTQIASQTGFGSLRSFNRSFRKQFGTSPTEYRKKRGHT